MKPLLVQVTVAKKNEAVRIAKRLVEKKLAACVQVISEVESYYSWKGKVCSGIEYLLLIKTSQKKWEKVLEFVKENHSYECPEIVAVSPSEVEEKYLKWWRESI